MHFDLAQFIQSFGPILGYFVVFGLVFLESGMLIGFFFPGDSLLFIAGFLASQGFFNIGILVLGCFIFAVLGDSIGYMLGVKLGPKIFAKENSIFFHKKHLLAAQKYYEKNGGKSILLARFIPVIRAFAPVVAGAGKMDYKKFVFFNLFGAVIWAIGVSLAGFYLGNLIPDIDKFLLPIIGIIVLVSLLPALHHMLMNAEIRASIIKKFKGK